MYIFSKFFCMRIRTTVVLLALAFGVAFSADPRIEQGAIFEAKGDYEMALGEYRAILAEQPQNSEAYFLAAEVYMKMPKQDLARALANYRLAYKYTPNMSKAYEGAAKVYRLMGQKAKAEEELAKDPKNKPAEVAPVETAAPVEAAAPAEQAAEPAKKAEPVAEAPKAEPKQEVTKAEPAKPAEASAKDMPTDPFEKGKAFLAEGKYKDAAAMWREVLAKQPGHAGAYFYAGVTRYEMGEYDKAEFNLKKGLAYKESGNDANYYLALVYQKLGRVDNEKKALSAYLKKAAPDAKFRAPAEARLAEMKASADSAKVANATPAEAQAVPEAKTAEASAQTAAAQPVAAPATPAATETAAEAQVPSETPSIANANLLFKAGNFAAALQMYKALLDTEISTDERYFATLQMGNIYRELRDFHSAVTRYRTVVQQYPESDWAAEAERALEDAVWLEKHASELPRRTH